MPLRLSEWVNVSRDDLERIGVYDTMLDFDSRLHVDPALLSRSSIPEFQTATRKIQSYFNNILRLVRQVRKPNDPLYITARKLLTFGEGLSTGLGYSQKGTSGSGIGPMMAERILDTVIEIVRAGTNDPLIFELVPIFEDKVGPDRISDMVSIILKDEFIAYRNTISGMLGIEPPVDLKGKELFFVPKELLSNLPTAEQWDDVTLIVDYNQEVRTSINNLIGKSWKQTANELTKSEIKTLLIENPSLIQELLRLYKKRRTKAYDFDVDHLGILLWDILGPSVANDSKLSLAAFKEITTANIFNILDEICTQFKKLIEHNGLVEHLYDSNESRRPERFPQLLFFAIAESYCNANNIDLNREINAGSGALDFKLSTGLAKVNLEIKYSSNSKLVEGYKKQLTTYNNAEGVAHRYSFYLILRVNSNSDNKIQIIRDIYEESIRVNVPAPKVIVINAERLPSASKR